MVFLPIVERELSLATRRKGTYRVRLWTTSFALALSFLFLVGNEISGSASPGMGRALFSILTFYAFGLSLLAGVFLASDCISQEKREGTLGLLFLTDLKSYDIVSGKFITVGLNALYGLVAVLPVTGLPLLLGGVTGAEFWRMALALVNALFFSLTMGMLVSACSRKANRAAANTTSLLILATVGLPLLGLLLSVLPISRTWVYAISFSPYFPFACALGHTNLFSYGACLASSNLFAWGMLAVTTWLVPRVWQDRPVKERRAKFITVSRSAGASARRNIQRAHLLDQSPLVWLAAREGGVRWRIWAIAVVAAVFAFSLFYMKADEAVLRGSLFFFLALAFVLKVFAATEACRFFADARRNGSLELILSTPLTARDIIRGQWLAFRRVMLGPVLVFCGAYLFVLILQMTDTRSVAGFMRIGTGFSNGNLFNGAIPASFINAVLMGYKLLILVADIFAIGWLGMWMGLTTKKPAFAPAWTILFGAIFPVMLFCIPNVFFDLFFILLGRERLTKEFRETAIPGYRTNRQSLVPLPNVPPVIRS